MNTLSAELINYLAYECARAGHDDQTLCQPEPFVASRTSIYPKYPGASTQRTLSHRAVLVVDSYPVGFSRLASSSSLWYSLERLQYPG